MAGVEVRDCKGPNIFFHLRVVLTKHHCVGWVEWMVGVLQWCGSSRRQNVLADEQEALIVLCDGVGNALAVCVDPGTEVVIKTENVLLLSVDGVAGTIEGISRTYSV